jgi:hypothetical protein
LQELLKRLQNRHVDCAEALTKKAAADDQAAAAVSPDTPNVMQTMMLSSRPKNAHKQRNIAQKPRKIRRKQPRRLLWRRRRTTMLLKKKCKSCNR